MILALITSIKAYVMNEFKFSILFWRGYQNRTIFALVEKLEVL